ncbi:MAG: hypothetical protein ACREA0_05090, partial [bacterium]
ARRAAQGLPVPSQVSFDYSSGAQAPQFAPGVARTPGARSPVTVSATTVIQFDGPAQAGHDRWPEVIVTDTRPDKTQGFVREGNYSQLIRDKMEEAVPGVWQQYEFGHEPRTYTFNETFTITDPELSLASALGTSTVADEFLMGLTIPGPALDYTINFDFEVCVLGICGTAVDFTAGFKLDWALGMRLPMDVSLTSTDPLSEGSTYFPTSAVGGLDWSAAQFAQAGVPPENGNEYVVRFEFLLGVFLEVFGADVIDLGPNIDINSTKSFASPFGPGATFALPPLDLAIWEFDASVASASVGFRLTPNVGSDKFTAAWAASSEASGAGTLTYTNSAVPVPAGPLLAIDGPGVAAITLNDLRYYFTQFVLDLGLFLHLDVFGVVDETFTVPVTDFDLSAITGNIYVGTHSGTPGALTASIPIENVAPTAEIDRTGTVAVNGVPTFIGAPDAFTGTARDPGRDALTLTWDWDDGAPAPDESTTYPVPHEVSETRPHAFGATCLYNVTFKAVDDDLAFGEDRVPVVITSMAENRARLEGYWQHQLGQNGAVDFDAPALECLLHIVGHLSAAFSEARSASTIQSAYNVLHLRQNGGSALERLDRGLLVTWLNCANGAFGYLQLMDTDRDGVGDTPFANVMAAAEVVRLNPGATTAALNEQTRILHTINAGRVGQVF